MQWSQQQQQQQQPQQQQQVVAAVVVAVSAVAPSPAQVYGGDSGYIPFASPGLAASLQSYGRHVLGTAHAYICQSSTMTISTSTSTAYSKQDDIPPGDRLPHPQHVSDCHCCQACAYPLPPSSGAPWGWTRSKFLAQ